MRRYRDFPWSALGDFQPIVVFHQGELWFAGPTIAYTDAYWLSRN